MSRVFATPKPIDRSAQDGERPVVSDEPGEQRCRSEDEKRTRRVEVDEVGVGSLPREETEGRGKHDAAVVLESIQQVSGEQQW